MSGVVANAGHQDSAVSRLAHVSLFAFGGVGFTGAISHGETDYQTILASATAEQDFEKVLTTGTPEAKCYALTGIKQLHPDRFRELAQRFANAKDSVSTMHGCMMSKQVLGDVVQGLLADPPPPTP